MIILTIGGGTGTEALSTAIYHQLQNETSGGLVIGCDMGTGTDYSPEPESYHDNYMDLLNRAVMSWEDMMKDMKAMMWDFVSSVTPLYTPYKPVCTKSVFIRPCTFNRKMMYSKSGFIPRRSKHKR